MRDHGRGFHNGNDMGPASATPTTGVSFDPSSNTVPLDQAGYAAAISPQEDAAPPVGDYDALDARPFNLTLEDLRELIRTEVGHIASVNDELNRLKTLYAIEAKRLQAPSLLAVPEGRLRELMKKWRSYSCMPGGFASIRRDALKDCADDLDALLASLSPPSDGQ